MHENWQNAKFLLESGNCETKLYFCLHIYKVEQKKNEFYSIISEISKS